MEVARLTDWKTPKVLQSHQYPAEMTKRRRGSGYEEGNNEEGKARDPRVHIY